MTLLNFVLWVLLTALLVSFVRTLMEKWGIMEWMRVHIGCEFVQKLLNCEFCTSFWLAVVVCIFLAIIVDPVLIFVPVFSCNLR